MTAKYDYVAEAQHAALYINQREAEQKMRKVLRKLVREALTHEDVCVPDDLADCIARGLVPAPKRGRK